MTTPGTSEPRPRRPDPTRQRSFSNVNPSTNSHITPSTNPGANSWLNTLADGLSWIEVQGGNVVSQATQAGLGETIRGGLQGVGGVVQGGLAKRPLLNGVLGGVGGTPPASDNGDAMSDYSIDNNHPSNGGGNKNNLLGSPGTSTPIRRRPASFLGLMKPRPQTPPAGGNAVSPAQSPVQTPTMPANSSRLFRNTTSPAPSPSSSPGPPHLGRTGSNNVESSASPGPTNRHPNSNTNTNSTPPRPPTLSSSVSSPPSMGKPTVTRLGPPRPANMTRLRHVELARTREEQVQRSVSTSTLTSTSQHPSPQQGQVQRGAHFHARTSSINSDLGNPVPGRGATLLRASPSGQSLDKFVLDGGAVLSAGTGSAPTGGLNPNNGVGRRRTSGWESSMGMERRGSNTAQTPQPGSRAGTPGLGSQGGPALSPMFNGVQGQTQQQLSAVASPPQNLRTRSYKPGFQPPGVRATRTQEFDEARKKVGEERSREEGRLTRRWAKLIDLHFNPMTGIGGTAGTSNSAASTSITPSTPPSAGKSGARPRLTPQISERFSALTNTLDQVTPRDVWRGFRSVTGVGLEQVELEKKRELERGLVVWEEDGEVRRCRICQSIFSLTNRKHHCRLCGRIVCSLPPTPATILALTLPSIPDGPTTKTGLPLGTRRETCSLLLVADYRTGKGHEVDEGFVGWMQMGSGAGVGEQGKPGASTATARRPDEVQVKGVRTCRECWVVVSRKQKMADMRQVSRFSRLYGALKSLEAEIADALPEYQDLIQELGQADEGDQVDPGSGVILPDLMTLHKHLVALFAEYDAFTKRIRSYPCPPSSAQERVQQAIARQAGLFMAREASTLQLLPKLQAQRHKRATSSAAVSIESSISPAPPIVDDTAMMLQPLLEQEAQLEVFIAEANAQRKLEDARTLLISLEELRQEIARIAASAGGV